MSPEAPQRAMTQGEKLLARACGLSSVEPGDMVEPRPELVIIHDGYVESAYRQLTALGYRRVMDPERIIFVTDHDVVYTSARVAERGRANRRIAREWRIGRFFDAGQGGHGHIFPLERGLVTPGMFLFAYDPHCTNFGSVGALAVPVLQEIVTVLATGTLLIEVPRSIRIELTGRLPWGVHARDVGFWLADTVKKGEHACPYDNRIVEFCGTGLDGFSLADRIALCNTLTEIGVANTLFTPFEPDDENAADVNADYETRLIVDLSQIVPQVALPGAPENAAGLETVVGLPIDHAYLGSCGSAMYEDFERALAWMEGRPVASGVRLIVVPGSVDILRRMAENGLTQRFAEAGAVFLPPSCGPCAGGRSGLLASGEVSISTAATNSAGRMGASDSLAYLASPLSVAAAAVHGRIVDPRLVAARQGVPHG